MSSKRGRGFLGAAVVAVMLAGVGCSAGDEAPAPSGRIVAFGLLIPAAGGKPERLRIGDQEFWDAAFSEDGHWLAFNPSPFVDDGGFRIRPTRGGETNVVPGQPPEDEFESYDLAWAPDGKSLAFVNGSDVFAISTDGTDLRTIGHGSSPTWTPDGEQIVFSAGDNRGDDLEITVVRRDGMDRRTLGPGLYPDVSPSGDQIAYSTPIGVFVQPLTGGEPRLVVRRGFGPVWSPDSEFIAFTRYTHCGHAACSGRIFVVPAEGGEPRAIGPTVGDPSGPDQWIP